MTVYSGGLTCTESSELVHTVYTHLFVDSFSDRSVWEEVASVAGSDLKVTDEAFSSQSNRRTNSWTVSLMYRLIWWRRPRHQRWSYSLQPRTRHITQRHRAPREAGSPRAAGLRGVPRVDAGRWKLPRAISNTRDMIYDVIFAIA